MSPSAEAREAAGRGFFLALVLPSPFAGDSSNLNVSPCFAASCCMSFSSFFCFLWPSAACIATKEMR